MHTHTNIYDTSHYFALAADPSTRLGRMLGTGPRQPDPPDGDGGGDEPPSATVSRDAYDKLLGQRKGDRARLQELETELAEYRSAREEAEAAKAREAEDWGKLEEQLKAENAKTAKERDEALGQLQAELTSRRRRTFAEAMAKQGGVENIRAVERLLPTLGLEDDAPESFDEAAVKKAIKALERDVPQLFGGESTTRKPPPGGGRGLDRDSPEYWREQGRRDTQHGPLDAYEAAKGQKR